MKIYRVNLDYIKYLHDNYDSRVQYNENQTKEYNENRPYVGVLLNVNGMPYFAPLEHPRPQHQTLKSNPHIIKIKDGKYGIIGLNNMIPVHTSQLIAFDINKDPNRTILLTQFIFCQDNRKHLEERAANIYTRRTERPNSFEEKVYCDFKKLEDGLKEYCRINNIELPQALNQNQRKAPDKPEAAKPLTMAERIAAAKEAARETAKETAATREMKKPPERE